MGLEVITFTVSRPLHRIAVDFADYKGEELGELGSGYLTERAEDLPKINLLYLDVYSELSRTMFRDKLRATGNINKIALNVESEVYDHYAVHGKRLHLTIQHLGKIVFIKGMALDMQSESFTPKV